MEDGTIVFRGWCVSNWSAMSRDFPGFQERAMKRESPAAIGSDKVRPQVAKFFTSHPLFQVPVAWPKEIARLLKRIK